MNITTSNRRRHYVSRLRLEQSEQTRLRILQGLSRVMAKGGAELSMPEVAHEAGVALRTVYRYFPTKYDLMSGLSDYVDARFGGPTEADHPDSPDELAATISDAFLALDRWDETLLAAFTSPLGGEIHRTTLRPSKHQRFIHALAPVTERMAEPDRTHLFNAIMMIANRYALRACKNDLGLTAEQAGETVTWLIRTLSRLVDCPEDSSRARRGIEKGKACEAQ